jgi:hypothetical protein
MLCIVDVDCLERTAELGDVVGLGVLADLDDKGLVIARELDLAAPCVVGGGVAYWAHRERTPVMTDLDWQWMASQRRYPGSDLVVRLSRSTVVTTPRKADIVADDDRHELRGFR